MMWESTLPPCSVSEDSAAYPATSSAQQAARSASPANGLSSPDRKPRTVDIEAGFNYENLTHGYAPWRQSYVSFIDRFTQRKVLYGMVQETNRFSLNDTEAMAGLYYPLRKQWTALIEASLSPTHNVLPKWSTLGQVEHSLGGGWGAQVGLRHREYNTVKVNTSNFGIEKYHKKFRFAYTFYATDLRRAGFSTTQRVDANYYYGNSSVNLTLASGRELENIIPVGVVPSRVKVVNIGGIHWFARDWGVSYSLSSYEQAPFYTRQGFKVGLRYRL